MISLIIEQSDHSLENGHDHINTSIKCTSSVLMTFKYLLNSKVQIDILSVSFTIRFGATLVLLPSN